MNPIEVNVFDTENVIVSHEYSSTHLNTIAEVVDQCHTVKVSGICIVMEILKSQFAFQRG